jgi:minor curlin subunit
MKLLSHHSVINKASAKHYGASLVMAGLLASSMISAGASGDNLIQEGARVAQYAYQIDTSTLQGNVTIIEQRGNNNQASITQSRSANYQFANFSKIYQRGNNNLANIMQFNGNNVGVIWQIGNNHSASIYQEGNSLLFQADIYQLGASGDVTISQSGSGLRGISVQQQNNTGSARPVTIDTY